MFPRRALLRTTRLLFGIFLLAQMTLALAACNFVARDAARAVAAAAGNASAPCHESGEPATDSGLCLPHCLGGQQSLDKPSVTIPALAPVAVHSAVPAAAAHALHAARRERPLPAAAPPRRILFQSFLI
jgi:hypothetical protein